MYALRSRVNALRRRMALELAVVRLRRLAQEYCVQWTVAVSDGRAVPDPIPLSEGWSTLDSGSLRLWRSITT